MVTCEAYRIEAIRRVDLMKYRQCVLNKESLTQTSWIPSKFATVGQILKLKRPDGDWDDGWKVTFAGAEVEEQYLPDLHKAIKKLWKDTSGSVPVGHK